jgi:hypothetical protein
MVLPLVRDDRGGSSIQNLGRGNPSGHLFNHRGEALRLFPFLIFSSKSSARPAAWGAGVF